MNARDKIVNTNIVLVLRYLHQQGLDRLEDLAVTTPQTDGLQKEYDELRGGLRYINQQMEHYQFLLEKGYAKK